MQNLKLSIIALVSIVAIFGINYMFALAGEPQSLWLFKLMGIM